MTLDLDTQRFWLSLTGLIAGAILAGAGVYFLGTQKFAQNPETGKFEIEIPVWGRIKTNYPASIGVMIGGAIVAYVVYLGSAWEPSAVAPPKSKNLWTVNGTLEFEKGAHDVNIKDITNISLEPPAPPVWDDGTLLLKNFYFDKKKGNEKIGIKIEANGYEPQTVHIMSNPTDTGKNKSGYSIVFDDTNEKIDIYPNIKMKLKGAVDLNKGITAKPAGDDYNPNNTGNTTSGFNSP